MLVRGGGPDLVLVTFNEKGFWQADLFIDAAAIPVGEFEQIGAAPDGFVTFHRNEDQGQAIARTLKIYPEARVEVLDDSDEDETT